MDSAAPLSEASRSPVSPQIESSRKDSLADQPSKAAGVVFKLTALPDGWKEKTDKKTGRTYFYNSHTKESSWKRPPAPDRPEHSKTLLVSPGPSSTGSREPDVEPSPTPSTSSVTPTAAERWETAGMIVKLTVLPDGWKEKTDKKTGRTYFYNSNTKVSSWKRPEISYLEPALSPTEVSF